MLVYPRRSGSGGGLCPLSRSSRSAEDWALTVTVGFLSIIILAIVGLFGPTVTSGGDKDTLVAGGLPRATAA
jgi:hypothetical protein